MKYVILIVSLLVLFVSVLVPGAQEQEMSQEEQKMMETWQKYANPGEKHKHLEYFVGEWESVYKAWFKPGTDPMILHQEIHVEKILEGRYVKAHIRFKEKLMDTPAVGIVITGYNNYKKEFIAISIDNMSTNVYITAGTLDKAGKVRTETGTFDDIFSGGKYKVKAVTTLLSKDKYSYESYRIDSKGSEFKTMEIIYTRKR
jgi:hypothetical protein